jgi:hypothetical protein
MFHHLQPQNNGPYLLVSRTNLVWFGLVLPRARGQSSRIMGRPPFAPPRLEIVVRAISAEKAGWLGGLGRKGGSDG